MTSLRLPLRAPDRTAVKKSSLRSIRCAFGSTSGGKTRTALAAARGENRTAGAGGHALAETVHLGTTTVVRLEGPLSHVCTPGRMIGTMHHGDRGTVVRTGCPMDRDVTPYERPHHHTARFSARSNGPAPPLVRALTRRRHPLTEAAPHPVDSSERPHVDVLRPSRPIRESERVMTRATFLVDAEAPLSSPGDRPVGSHRCGQPCGKNP